MPDELSLFSAFLAGLFSGVHCVGMCAGIVTALSVNLDPTVKPLRRVTTQVFYNFGRISSYMLFGAIAGAFGHSLDLWLETQLLQRILLGLAATMLLAMGLYLAGWWRGLAWLERHIGQRLWRRIEPFGRRFLPIRRLGQAYAIGTIWGWLPCGLVYSMVFYALTGGSALNGALIMLSFGLGTLPNLLATGLVAGSLIAFLRLPAVRVLAGLLVIGIAVMMMARIW